MIRYPAVEPECHHQYLVDTAPEMRMQVIRHEIRSIDGVLITHAHADHVFGLDDLRRFNAVLKRPINLYTETDTLQTLRSMFGYIFEPHKNVNASFVPRLVPQQIIAGQPLGLGTAQWTPIRLLHGRLPILGFRVEHNGQALAYCTDVSRIPPESYQLLQDLDVLVIDALRYRHHPTHQTVDQALDQIEQIRPHRAFLTHIAHDILHADLEAKLPEHVFIAFDGLVVGCR